VLALTKKTEYALSTLAHLARYRDRPCSAREIAERYRMPSAMLTNVLKTLSHAGLVTSVRGTRGGYQLAVAPAQISLGRIMEVIEGPFRFVQCAGDGNGRVHSACDRESCCPIRSVAAKLHGRIQEYMETVTLSEMVHDAFSPMPIDMIHR